MEQRYIRNVPALTEAECALLRTRRVLVVGCGGLGGYLIEFMARLGVGSIRAVDGDRFEESNLNRQLLSEMSLMGQSKALAAARRVQSINPQVQFEAVDEFLTRDNAHRLVDGCDAVLDGLDNIAARHILSQACTDAGVPYIFGAIRGWIVQSGICMPGDRLMDILYPEGTVLHDKSSLSFTPAFCASMQAALCTKLLVGRPVPTGTVHYVDLMHHEFEAISLQ